MYWYLAYFIIYFAAMIGIAWYYFYKIKTYEDYMISSWSTGFWKITGTIISTNAAAAVINAYINTAEYKTTGIQHRVEHLQLVNRDDIKLMASNDIGGSFFMNHIYYFGDVHKSKFLGPERTERMEPVKWADELGMVSTIHSDCPVTDISPLGTIRIACERKTRNGDILGEDMRLNRTAAYRKMTIDAAILNGTSDIEGSVEIGKYADFAVLSENPFDEGTELSDELVQMTIVNGEIVYKK